MRPRRARLRPILVALAFALLIGALIPAHGPFIQSLVSNPLGETMIALARTAPPGSTLMLPWGPRYFAVGFARDVLGTLPDTVQLVDHRADYRAILNSGRPLLTQPETFFIQSPAWWAERIGGPVWLQAAAPGLVQISNAPRIRADAPPDGLPVALDAAIACRADQIDLTVEWGGPMAPMTDWSVFVHGLTADGVRVAQGDQSAPVYGWRPLSSWAPGEQVRDVYSLPRTPDLTALRVGFYRALPEGGFENASEWTIPVVCEDAA